jgi:hypothetical protein
MAVLGDSAAKDPTPFRARGRLERARPALQAGTALRALIPAKEPGRAMRGFTALQARAVRLVKDNALQAGTALRALLLAKEPGRATREGTAIWAPLQPRGLGFAMWGITAMQARAVHIKCHALVAGTALRALIPAKELGRAMRGITALDTPLIPRGTGLAHRGITAMQARTVQINCNALQAGTALRALIPAKEPGRAMRGITALDAPLQPRGAGFAMRGITAMQARTVQINFNALQAGTALRALIPAKEPGRATRDDTAF